MIRFLQSGNKAAKYILSGFLLIICVSMVWYLVPSSTTDTNTARTGIVASVAGEDIRTDEVNKLVQTQLRMRQYPESVAPFIAQQVIQQLIQRQEVRYEAGRLGLKASDQEVRDELQNGMYKTYFFPGGKWIGQEAYEKFLTENGTTVSAFESDVRDSLLGRKLFSAITAGVNVPSAEVEKAYKDRNTDPLLCSGRQGRRRQSHGGCQRSSALLRLPPGRVPHSGESQSPAYPYFDPSAGTRRQT